MKVLREELMIMREENKQLRLKHLILEQENKELKRQLNQNSKNSHLPPSRDKHAIKIKSAFNRKKSGRNGGQPGHPGTTLEKSEMVDETVEIRPGKCACGKSLKNELSLLWETRQEFEMPEVDIWIKEYQLMQIKCPCCTRINRGSFPHGINAPTQYGSRLRAFICMLNTDYKVPMKKLQQLMGDMFGIGINESTIHNINKKAFENLEETEEQIQEKLLGTKIIHVDETGVESGDILEWGHVISSSLCTYLYINPRREGEAILDNTNLLSKYKGRMIHDCYSTYFKLTQSNHGICGSHLLRELQAQLEEGRTWASKMHQFLLKLKDQSSILNKKHKQSIYRNYIRILQHGKSEEPTPIRIGIRGREKKSKGLNLIHRMLNYQEFALAFAFDKEIPFTNNQAERDLRHLKIKLKISGRFRSLQGSRYYARITSFISTLRKNGLNILESMTEMFQNHNYKFQWA
ncbi:MAG: IS66 family transposase [Saprospiraceae bacterium]